MFSKERVGAYLRRWLGWAGVGVVCGLIWAGCASIETVNDINDEFNKRMMIIIEPKILVELNNEDEGYVKLYEYKNDKLSKYKELKGSIWYWKLGWINKKYLTSGITVREYFVRELTDQEIFNREILKSTFFVITNVWIDDKGRKLMIDKKILRVHKELGCGEGRNSCLVIVRRNGTKIFYRRSAEEYMEIMKQVNSGVDINDGEVVD